MLNIKHISILLILIIIAGAAISLFPSDTKHIKKQFRAIEQWAAKEPEENQLVMGSKIRKLRGLLADSIQVEAPAYQSSGIHDANEVAQRATMGRSRYSKIALKFYDLEVDILDEQSAKVIATGRLTGASPEGEAVSETHELECLLQKRDGDWLLSEIEVVDVLQK